MPAQILNLGCGLDDRVTLPSNPSRKVKGVDVLPWVLSPLMGPEEIDMDVSTRKTRSEPPVNLFVSNVGIREPA